MSMFDFFFPQQAAASHLRAMRDQQQDAMRMQQRKARDQQADADSLHKRLTELENDMGFLALTVAALLDSLDAKGALSRDDVRQQLERLDIVDGMRDGKLNIRDLRDYLRKNAP